MSEYLNTETGEGKEIVALLMEKLSIPKTTTSFSVYFEMGKHIEIKCAYIADKKE